MPEIIFTENPSSNVIERGGVISISSRQFINLIKHDNIKIIFSGYKPNHKNKDFYLYILKNGFIINTSANEIEYLENFFKVQKEGLSNFYEFHFLLWNN